MTTEELKQRTMSFALRTARLAESLPKTWTGRMVTAQLVRCGPAVGANYRAACKARSRAEFVAKIGIVEEEADESAFWMEFIVAHGLMPENRVTELLKEANELSAIVGRSRITASKGLKRRTT